MHDWEATVKSYKEDTNPKMLQNILLKVQTLINDDLASFEIESILSTLFGRPVNLLNVIRGKGTIEEWDDCVSDALKLLAELVSKYNNVHNYYNDITNLCVLPYATRIRHLALTCLTNIARKSSLPAKYLSEYIYALEGQSTCMAPHVLLIGAICEYHPEEVVDHFNRIWRLYLNLLDDNKKSSSIKKTVLQGVLCLFKHYGMELTTLELEWFYEKLVVHTKISKFEDVCLSILENHSSLFRERLSNDIQFRTYLWCLNNSRPAILSVYKVVADTVKEGKIVQLINELEKFINSTKYYQKFTALHAILYVHTKYISNINLNEYIDIQTVDFEIRNGNINYEICDAIFWCVKSKVLYSDKLLQTSLLFYENFPVNKRRELLQCFLQADDAIRQSTVIFLTNYPESIIWRHLLALTDEDENIASLTKYVQNYIVNILEREEESLHNREVLPNYIKSFAAILAFLPSKGTFRVLSRYAKMYAEFVPGAILHGNDMDGRENISILHCPNDESKVRCSLTYIDRSDYFVPEMIIALETILSRKDINGLNMIKAIHKLEKLIKKKELKETEMTEMLHKVLIISKRIDSTKKEDRVLERELILFLAQYGRDIQETPKNNTLIKQLEDILIWEVDNDLKLKLGTLIISAIEYEDIEALNILFNLITSKLATKTNAILRKALLLVVTKLSRYDVNRDMNSDVTSDLWQDGDGVLELLQLIMEEKSLKSRKALCTTLEEALRSHENVLLEKFLENLLTTEQNDTKYQAVLELLKICTKMLEDNNLLSKKFLPNIIIKILNIKKYNLNVFNMAANVFTDKIELFDGNTIDNTIDNILKIINKMGTDDRLNIRIALKFIKKIFDMDKSNKNFLEYCFCACESFNLLILIEIKLIFQFDELKSEEIVRRNGYLNSCNERHDKAVFFEFVRTFSNVLLGSNKLNTFSIISNFLMQLTPQHQITSDVLFALSMIRTHDMYFDSVQEAIKNIIEDYPIKEITEGIEKYSLDNQHEVFIPSLREALKYFDGPILMGSSSIVMIKRWLDRIFVLHDLGVLERNLERKMEYLTDLVEVSLGFFSREEFMEVLVKGKSGEGVKFCRAFMKATYGRLVERPYIIVSTDMESSSVLLIDILKYAAVNDKYGETVELAEAAWPVFCNNSTHEEQVQALTYLSILPTSIQHWVFDIVNKNETRLDKKIEFVSATSGKISSIHTVLRSYLPSRLSELRGTSATCFKVYLDILSRKNLDLLDQVAQMASNDKTKGWWDDAIQLCMSGLADAGEGQSVLSLVHSKCNDARGHSTTRLLLPLLRFSKLNDCEQFFYNVSEDLLSVLKRFPRSKEDRHYEECVSEYVRALNVIQIIFEKIPKENINKCTKNNGFVKTICKLGCTLRDIVDASFREFHCANYNCLVAAICLMDPGAAVYRQLYNSNVWIKLINDDEIPDLPVREQWNQRVTRHAVSNTTTDVTLRMASARTRMFTRTLSENPYMYDLTNDVENETVEFQEIMVKDNIINRHPCIASFKSLFNKRNGVEDVVCMNALEETLKNNEIHTNVRWLLGQAICNSKEELKAYASGLQPALLNMIVGTSQKEMLNDLHLDVLDTLILWHEDTNSVYINDTIRLLISTAIFYGARKNIYYSLVDRLVKLLNIWQNVVIPWSSFEMYFAEKNAEKLKVCLHILKNILKCQKYIQELVPALLGLIEHKHTYIEVCEVFGIALQLDTDREKVFDRFRKFLIKLHRSDVMEYLKVLYYTQIGCPFVCDYSNFRKITDLLSKITVSREKLKCLRILDAYIRNARNEPVTIQDTINLVDHLGSAEGLKLAKTSLNLLSDVEKERVLSVILEENYKKDLFEHVAEFLLGFLKLKLSPEYEPAAKRPARELNSLLLSDPKMQNILKLLSIKGDKHVYGLNDLLSDDLRIRFYECFYIMIVMREPKSESNLLGMIYLFLYRFKSMPDEGVSKPDINSRYMKEDINVMLLQYSKKNAQMALSFIVQLLQVYPKTPGFDFIDDDIVNLLSVGMPWTIEIVRAARVWRCERLHQNVVDLLEQTKGTDVENLGKLLSEEFKLHNHGPEQFSLGLPVYYDESMPEMPIKFSIEDLLCSFGKLSNWSDLTVQQKKGVKKELPCLWTTTESFEDIVNREELKNPFWLNAMVSTYKNDKSFVIPSDVYKSPRNYFDLSVISEIATWKEIRDGLQSKIILHNIHPSDCMAQWAARIMLRSLEHRTGNELRRLSRSYEAAWCERANEMAIHAPVLQCCRRTTDLYESEMLHWLSIKLTAVRGIALEENNESSLKSALDLADTNVPKFIEMTSNEDAFKMDLITLLLRNDLKSLNFDHVGVLRKKIENINNNKMALNDKKNLESICIVLMTFLDRCEYAINNIYNKKMIFFANDIFYDMAEILSIYVQLDLGKKSGQLANVIINKLNSTYFNKVLPSETKFILDALYLIRNDLHYISLEQLKSKESVFCDNHEFLKYLGENENKILRTKSCLSLIGDPQYLLLNFCQQLLNANDQVKFDKTLKEMKNAIFDNDLAQVAPDYQILNKFKVLLYGIHFDDTQKRKETLLNVISQLEKAKGDCVYLSQVCPTLASAKEMEDVQDELCRLFRLKTGVRVVKFEEKIQIMPNTLHRPAILTCRLSNGKQLRCMVKRGERVRIHCAAMAMNDILGLGRGYRITPLSDTCCLIEYLEDHEPFRKMITSKYNIDIQEINQRTNDKELITDITKSLQEFNKLCEKIPSYMLRHAIEENSTSIGDFINKKKNFLQSVCDMTVFSYICGMTDRHLENMMYSKQDGGACHVDCDAILQDDGEIPPARLTSNILAVCNAQVLEARIQTKLSELREEHIILPSLSVAFSWIGEQYREKFDRVVKIIQGKELCFNHTIECLRLSKSCHNERYIELLNEIFEDIEKKTEYTVEEQVSSLFRQSTDPRILSVTRSNWEPWV